MDSELLSTGEVAKLCGVTPDAVLKWIKKGKLPATRTPGGHYRVSRSTCTALGLCGSEAPAQDTAPTGPAQEAVAPPQCWEYFGQRGTPREECRSCVVYLARAQNCYRLAELGEEVGHRLNFCATECAECSYYRASRGMATSVLVVTRDEALTRRLASQSDPRRIQLHFAKSGYECATIIGTFPPALVVMDSDLPEVREGQLPECIARDQRIPATVLFVACREGDEEAVEGIGVPHIAPPFTAEQIEQLAAGCVFPRSSIPRDVA